MNTRIKLLLICSFVVGFPIQGFTQSTGNDSSDQIRKSDAATSAVNSAEAAYRRQDWVSASSEFRKLSTDYPKNGHFAFRLANAAAQAGNFDEAAKSYDSALRIDPQDMRSLYNLALVRLMQAESALIQAYSNNMTPPALKEDIKRTLDAARVLLRTNANPIQSSAIQPGANAVKMKTNGVEQPDVNGSESLKLAR